MNLGGVVKTDKDSQDPFSGIDSNKKREILNWKFIEKGGVLNFNPSFDLQEVKENTTPLEVILNSNNGENLL